MKIKDLKWKPEGDSIFTAKTEVAIFTIKKINGTTFTIVEKDGTFISVVMDISEYKSMDIYDAVDFIKMKASKEEKQLKRQNNIIKILAEEINGKGLGNRILAYSELRPIAKRIIQET